MSPTHLPLTLEIEPLEERRMLAGDVRVSLNRAGVLSVTGDNADNVIDIVALTDSSITVDPRGDTTVNGGALGAPLTLTFERLSDLRINMRGGNDIVFVSASSATVPFRNGTFVGGSGNDFVRYTDIDFTGNLRVSLGSGEVNADTGGSGIDQTAIIDRSVVVLRNLSLQGGTTNDLLRVNGGPASQAINVGGSLTINGSSGADAAEIEDINANGPIRVNLGSGDDQLRTFRAALGRTTFNGGSGFDTYTDQGTTLFTQIPRLIGFEA